MIYIVPGVEKFLFPEARVLVVGGIYVHINRIPGYAVRKI